MWGLQYDNARGNYQLKESKLADVLCRACGVDTRSSTGKTVIEWRSSASKNAGNFAAVAEDVRP